ncbi:Hypothetical protein, putative, partial [Bodo saltans]
LRVTAKAESTMDSSAAKKKALVDLHKLLLSKAGMLSLTRFWHTPSSSLSSSSAKTVPASSNRDTRSVCLTTTIALPSLAVRERLAAHLLLVARKGHAEDGRTEAKDTPLKSLPSTTTAPAVTDLKITPMLAWFLTLRGDGSGGGATSNSSTNAKTIDWEVLVQRLGLTTTTATGHAATFVTPLGRRAQSMIRVIASMPVARWLQECTNTTEAAEVAEELHQLVDGISRGEWFSELLIRCSVFLALSQTIEVGTRVCADAVAIAVKLLMSPIPAVSSPTLESIDNQRQEQPAYTAPPTTTELLTWLESRQKLQEDVVEGDTLPPNHHTTTGKVGTSVTSSAERIIAQHIETSLGVSSPPPPPAPAAAAASVSSRPPHHHTQRDTSRARLQLAYVCAFGESASAFVMAQLENDGKYTAVTLGDDGRKHILQLPPPVSCSNSKSTAFSSVGAAVGVPCGSSQPSSLPRRVLILLCTAAPQVLGTSIGMSIDSPWLIWFGASVSSLPAIRPYRGEVPEDNSQSTDPLLRPRLLEIEPAGDVINLRTLWNGRACFCVSMDPLTTSSGSCSSTPTNIAGGAPSAAVSWLGRKPNAIVQPIHSSHTVVGRSSLTTARPPTLAGGALFLEQLEELAHHLRRDLGNTDGGDGAPRTPLAAATTLDFVLELLLTCQQLVMVDDVRQRTSATGRPQHCIGVLETL